VWIGAFCEAGHFSGSHNKSSWRVRSPRATPSYTKSLSSDRSSALASAYTYSTSTKTGSGGLQCEELIAEDTYD
jgi:hypothetical protein